jgi:hypothetical protein
MVAIVATIVMIIGFASKSLADVAGHAADFMS